MKNLLFLYDTYVRQHGPDDCGIACLAMLLNYSGRTNDAAELLRRHKSSPVGSSLLDLREIAGGLGISSKCVTMDTATLRELRSPCILHVLNTDNAWHFIVYFQSRFKCGRREYFIADPATGMGWMPESELSSVWQKNAALYTEQLPFRTPPIKDHSWIRLIRSLSLQKTLFLSIPLLNIAAGALGIALSWLLQRGLTDSLTDRNNALLITIVLLLGLIMTGRNIGNYLKQRVLIRINADVRKKHLDTLVLEVTQDRPGRALIKKRLGDVQKIQNAAAGILAILFPESLLLFLLLSGLFYYGSVPGIISAVYITVMTLTGIKYSATHIREQSALAQLNLLNEKYICLLGSDNPPEGLPGTQKEREARYIIRAKSLAATIGNYGLLYDCLGSLAVITTLFYCLYSVRRGAISYNLLLTEVIATYLITASMPRVCQAFPVITEGARLVSRSAK
jgi:ABC-type bacteriocin/lantibiotic exporter with double-glycine peptidase domain